MLFEGRVRMVGRAFAWNAGPSVTALVNIFMNALPRFGESLRGAKFRPPYLPIRRKSTKVTGCSFLFAGVLSLAERPHSQWRDLMRASQDGDRAAYDRLLREVAPFIRALALRRNRNAQWAEDAVQEVLLTLHRVRHTYDPARPFEPWLATIAERRCVDLHRRKSRVEVNETSNDSAYESFADPAANKAMEVYAQTDGLAEVIATLPPQQREAIELLKLKELSLAQASRATGRSEGALKVNVHRAIKSLRARLTGDRRR